MYLEIIERTFLSDYIDNNSSDSKILREKNISLESK